MAKLDDKNRSLAFQVNSLLKEREIIKLESQMLFNSIKMTRVQHQWEVNELIENVNQNTYAYGDLRSKNQDLLMTISELKGKLKSVEKGKSGDTKYGYSKNHKKTVKAGQTRTRERKESTKAGDLIARKDKSQLKVNS
ncbi:hypothetical protein Tco_1059914 [Tanacetum coccineum]